MALSRIVYTGDGVTTQWAIPFALGYIRQADVKCRVADEVDGGGDPVYRTLTFNTETLVTVGGTTPADGVRVEFTRTTARDELLVDYEDDDILNEENMNTAQKQALMLVHEVLDGRFSVFQNNIDMGGYRMVNLGQPVDPTDAVTLEYLTTSTPEFGAAAAAGAAAGEAAAVAAVAGVAADLAALDDAVLKKAENLSGITDQVAARTALGLGNSATRAVGTTSGTVATGDDTRITGAAQKASNLSDLANVVTARTNLKIVTMSLATYNALGSKDSSTLYMLTA